ncbi:MAG: fumarate hydratase [Eubacteriaceae bacterium]
MKTIDTSVISEHVYKLLLEVNCNLPLDVKDSINKSINIENSPIGKEILSQIEKNYITACQNNIPICQDTGMVVIFIEIGQEVKLVGEFIDNAINKGIINAYKDGYFRKSVVGDPLKRENTDDNTPGIIHYEIVEGDEIKITVMPKGFGSENMSAMKMLKPSDGIEGVKAFVLETVSNAGPNACPPLFIGVGIGGTFEKCALLAKKALCRSVDKNNNNLIYKKLEEDLISEINKLGIGPMGMGGNNTVLGVNIETYPTHIAGLPVAVNICCHVNRHKSVTIN